LAGHQTNFFQVFTRDGEALRRVHFPAREGHMATLVWEHMIIDDADYAVHIDYC
jgi:hypothetical protein